MMGAVWVVYGLLMLLCGGGIGAVLAGVAHSRRAEAEGDLTQPGVAQHGTLAEHRRRVEARASIVIGEQAPSAAGYVGRHAAGIAIGTSNQQHQIEQQVTVWRSLDVTGELERILSEPDPDAIVIESPTGFAAWMAATRQPWAIDDQFVEAAP